MKPLLPPFVSGFLGHLLLPGVPIFESFSCISLDVPYVTSFIKSKGAQIEGLEREIKGLKEITPMKVREYFLSVKLQLEEYNEHLKQKLEMKENELQDKNKEILILEEKVVEGENFRYRNYKIYKTTLNMKSLCSK